MAQAGIQYCAKHRVQHHVQQAKWPVLGALAGNLLLPGTGGLVLGAIAGALANTVTNEPISKKPIFVSFDYDHDLSLKHLVIAQAKLPTSPFTIIDCSLVEAAPEKTWTDKARKAIKRSELVLVMVGKHTYRAPGVLKEVEIAREEGVKVVQMIAYKNVRVKPVKGAGRLYAWNWKNLQALLN